MHSGDGSGILRMCGLEVRTSRREVPFANRAPDFPLFMWPLLPARDAHGGTHRRRRGHRAHPAPPRIVASRRAERAPHPEKPDA